VLGVCVRMSLCRLECRSARLCMLGDVSFLVTRILGHVLSPLISGFASANFMPEVFVLLRRCARLCLLRRCV
jgi:hypothetical protein